MKAAAIILNIMFTGVGSFVINKWGQGIGQLVLFWGGLLLSLTVIGAIVGLPMMMGAWIWGIVTAASASPDPIQVTVMQAPAGPAPGMRPALPR